MIDRSDNSDVNFNINQHFAEIAAFLNQPYAGVGIFKWCIETNDIQVTNSYLEMIGVEEIEEEKGLLGFIHPSHRDRAVREIRHAILGNSERFESLYRMHSNRKLRQIFLIKGSISRRDSTPVVMFGMVIDVTNILRLILDLVS